MYKNSALVIPQNTYWKVSGTSWMLLLLYSALSYRIYYSIYYSIYYNDKCIDIM